MPLTEHVGPVLIPTFHSSFIPPAIFFNPGDSSPLFFLGPLAALKPGLPFLSFLSLVTKA